MMVEVTRTMKIGQAAVEAGVNVQTLRFYERRGLLTPPKRRESGYREYDPEAVRLVRFVKRAQELGFTLKEVQELLRLREDQKASCTEVRSAARSKVEDIDSKVKTLRAIRRALGTLINSCTSDGSTRYCPILEAIEATEVKEKRK